jgi:hypothetical protein
LILYGFGSLLLDDDWFSHQPEALSQLRDTYLAAWTRYAPMPRLQAAFVLWNRLRPFFLAAHQSTIVAAYQEMLSGSAYIPETATGNTLQDMQWWLASHWRHLLQSFESA